jgi:hypothetical protein
MRDSFAKGMVGVVGVALQAQLKIFWEEEVKEGIQHEIHLSLFFLG